MARTNGIPRRQFVASTVSAAAIAALPMHSKACNQANLIEGARGVAQKNKEVSEGYYAESAWCTR